MDVWTNKKGPPNNFFSSLMKKTIEYFLKFLFHSKVQYFRLIMENNFIAASTSHSDMAQYLSQLTVTATPFLFSNFKTDSLLLRNCKSNCHYFIMSHVFRPQQGVQQQNEPKIRNENSEFEQQKKCSNFNSLYFLLK